MGTLLQFLRDVDVTATTVVDSAPPAPTMPPLLKRGALVGRYVIVDLIGGGGMGMVYAAYDPDLDRRVAIKLVRPEVCGEGPESAGRARLLREAQALAKLQHPNVVAVHDVGTFEDRVFVAMELVEGTTLAKWLAGSKRSWREIVATFIQAGQGVAAAHSSGIIHRDFKPQNVLIAREGRVRVADFGLARVSEEADSAAPIADLERAPTELGAAPIGLATPLTRTGLFLGTPAYASPEQLLGRRTDERTDQFSFCVALHEALYGERPFAGDTEAELLGAIRDGAVRPAPTGAPVPKWLREIIVRGLHADPERRHASMDALLGALRCQPVAMRRVALVAGVLAVAAFAGIAAARSAASREGGMCQDPQQKLTGIWDRSRKDSVRDAFSRTSLPYSADALKSVERMMDDYASRWRTAVGESCAARQEAEFPLRIECLNQLADEMRAQSDLLARADDRVVENAVQMVQSLPPIERCSKSGVLSLPPLPPAQLRPQVDGLRKRIAEAKALGQSGRYAEGLAIATRASEAAGAIDYRAAGAEALYERGVLEDGSGNLDAAARTLADATLAAEAGRHDHLLAEAWLQLAWVADERGRYEEAHDNARRAMAAIDRLGREDALRAILLNRTGNTWWHQGKMAEAIETHRQALALAERTLPAQDRNLAWILNDLGVVLVANRRYDEAIGYLERARSIKEATLGSAHPDVARTLNNIGWVEMMRGNLDKAAADSLRALDIKLRALGPNHPSVATSQCSAAEVLLAKGDAAQARQYAEQGLASMEQSLGKQHPGLVEPLTIIGKAWIAENAPERAIAPLERALALPQGHFAVGEERTGTKAALTRAHQLASR